MARASTSSTAAPSSGSKNGQHRGWRRLWHDLASEVRRVKGDIIRGAFVQPSSLSPFPASSEIEARRTRRDCTRSFWGNRVGHLSDKSVTSRAIRRAHPVCHGITLPAVPVRAVRAFSILSAIEVRRPRGNWLEPHRHRPVLSAWLLDKGQPTPLIHHL